MRSRFTLLSIMLWALMVSACNTDSPLVTRIIVDFPHGALRLLVQRDGDSRLFYGALPTYRAIQDNPFNIDDLFQQLQPRLHDVLPAEGRPLGQPYGMATIEFSDGSQQDYLIYDEIFALELFKAACTNIAQEEDVGEKIFTAECAKLGSAAPFMNPRAAFADSQFCKRVFINSPQHCTGASAVRSHTCPGGRCQGRAQRFNP